MPGNANVRRSSSDGSRNNNSSSGRGGSVGHRGSLNENAVHKPVPGRGGKNK